MLQLYNVSNGQATKDSKETRTDLDVRLLISPVVVLYCFASAKMDAIPELNNGGQ